MSRPKIRVSVLEEAEPIYRALDRLHVDIGSVLAASLFANQEVDMPAALHGVRWLCVALSDIDEVGPFAKRLRAELAGDQHAIDLTNRVMLQPLPLDAVLVVFLGIVAIEAPEPS